LQSETYSNQLKTAINNKLETNTINNNKPNAINLNSAGLNTESPESKTLNKDKASNTNSANTGTLGKSANKSGLNIIPLKGLNIQSDNKHTGTLNERLSPTNKMNLTNNITSVTISPKGIPQNKLPLTTKNTENKIQFETTKPTFKSPSPNKGSSTVSTKLTKKSPDAPNTKK
jgi:hypothetical protein